MIGSVIALLVFTFIEGVDTTTPPYTPTTPPLLLPPPPYFLPEIIAGITRVS